MRRPTKAVIAVLSRRLGLREVGEMGRGYVSYGTVSSAPVFVLDTSGIEGNLTLVVCQSRQEERAELRHEVCGTCWNDARCLPPAHRRRSLG